MQWFGKQAWNACMVNLGQKIFFSMHNHGKLSCIPVYHEKDHSIGCFIFSCLIYGLKKCINILNINNDVLVKLKRDN